MEKVMAGLGVAAALLGAVGFARYVAEGAGWAERVVTLPGEFATPLELASGTGGVLLFIGMAAFFGYKALKAR